MTFFDDGRSIQGSRPREFYKIVQSASVTYRIASGDRDVTYLGDVYTANPVARTEVGISSSVAEWEVTLTLPLTHPLPQRYMKQGTPPRQIAVTIYQMETGGDVEIIWAGYITSMAFTGHIAKFRIPSKMSRAFQRKLPSITAGKLCPHILFDSNCRVDPAAWQVTVPVVTANGRTLTMASLGSIPPGVSGDLSDDTFLVFGDVVHSITGERQTILTQTGTVLNLGDPTFTIDMWAPIPDLTTGDVVVLSAGCLHDKGACYAKFANMANMGGFPDLPTVNLFSFGNGMGIFST